MKNTQTKKNKKPSDAEFMLLLSQLSPEQLKIVKTAITILIESGDELSDEEILAMATARVAEEK